MRILVLNHHGIGDVIMSLPLLDGLRAGFREAEIAVVVKSEVEASLVRTTGIDRTICFHRERMGPYEWLRFFGALFGRYQMLIATINTNGRAANRLGKWIGIRERVGHMTGVGFTIAVKTPHQHKVLNNLEILSALGLPRVTNEPCLRLPKQLDDSCALDISHDAPLLAVHVGTGILIGGRRFDYSVAKFKEVALSLLCRVVADLLQLGKFTLLLVGGPEDRERGQAFEAMVPRGIRVLNKIAAPSIIETAQFIQNARVFLGGDSGLAHVAAAVGTPVVALFGPTDPSITGPYGTSVQVFSSSTCPLRPCYPEKIYQCRWSAEDRPLSHATGLGDFEGESSVSSPAETSQPISPIVVPVRTVRACLAGLEQGPIVRAVAQQLFQQLDQVSTAYGG